MSLDPDFGFRRHTIQCVGVCAGRVQTSFMVRNMDVNLNRPAQDPPDVERVNFALACRARARRRLETSRPASSHGLYVGDMEPGAVRSLVRRCLPFAGIVPAAFAMLDAAHSDGGVATPGPCAE